VTEELVQVGPPRGKCATTRSAEPFDRAALQESSPAPDDSRPAVRAARGGGRRPGVRGRGHDDVPGIRSASYPL